MSSKNSAFNRLPRFIWGEATDDTSADGLDAYEYLTHTRYPRFLCRVAKNEAEATGCVMKTNLVSGVGLMPDNHRELYVCQTHGIAMSDFVWLDSRPEPEVLQEACDAAILNRLLRDDALGLNDDE